MKFKHLESHLENVIPFVSPNILLEQYTTPSRLAAEALCSIDRIDDIEGKHVLDLGCGTGVLSIGAVALDAGHCLAVDVDESALRTCLSNVTQYQCPNIDFLAIDVNSLLTMNFLHSKFDIAIMNPPFGTKNNSGIDLKFVSVGLEAARDAVYSFHKTTSVPKIQKFCTEKNKTVESILKVNLPLPNVYTCHKKEKVLISVDLLRFSHL